jgi:DNA-binding MarR family transcriptional regulator
MSAPSPDLSTLDRLIHEPARLVILTALSACRSADFVYLQSLTRSTSGNLSQHLTKLQAGGLIDIEKTIVRKMPRTVVRLSSEGRRAIDQYWQRLKQMRQAAIRWGVQARRMAEG